MQRWCWQSVANDLCNNTKFASRIDDKLMSFRPKDMERTKTSPWFALGGGFCDAFVRCRNVKTRKICLLLPGFHLTDSYRRNKCKSPLSPLTIPLFIWAKVFPWTKQALNAPPKLPISSSQSSCLAFLRWHCRCDNVTPTCSVGTCLFFNRPISVNSVPDDNQKRAQL